MADNLVVTGTLPETGCTRADIETLIETANPTSSIVDGTTLKVASNKLAAEVSVPRWQKWTLTYASFNTAATTVQAALFTLQDRGVIHGVKAKHSTAFAGPSLKKCSLTVGIVAEPASYMAPFDVKQAPAADLVQLNMSPGGEQHSADGLGVGTSIVAQLTLLGCNGNGLTAGVVDIWVLWSATL
jgi:hypothetical protein